jgi:hypothetical protein
VLAGLCVLGTCIVLFGVLEAIKTVRYGRTVLAVPVPRLPQPNENDRDER